MMRTIWFSNLNIRFSHVNGKNRTFSLPYACSPCVLRAPYNKLNWKKQQQTNNKTDQSVFAWYFGLKANVLGGLVEGLAPEYIQKRSGKVNILLNNTSLEIVCPSPDYFPTKS